MVLKLVLEPISFEPAKVFQNELFKAGIPLTAFNVDDLDKEYERLSNLGVTFSLKPTEMGATKLAVFMIPAEIIFRYSRFYKNLQLYPATISIMHLPR